MYIFSNHILYKSIMVATDSNLGGWWKFLMSTLCCNGGSKFRIKICTLEYVVISEVLYCRWLQHAVDSIKIRYVGIRTSRNLIDCVHVLGGCSGLWCLYDFPPSFLLLPTVGLSCGRLRITGECAYPTIPRARGANIRAHPQTSQHTSHSVHRRDIYIVWLQKKYNREGWYPI